MCPTLIKALIKLKNASLLNKEIIYLNFDLKYFEILRILYKEGFIQSYKIDKENYQTIVYLRFFQNKSVIDRLKFYPCHHAIVLCLIVNYA